ncbi:MAG TPA: glutathione peroxidase [Saprospiraceae bacterium]|nr:glutathione peroxidase [Saprospiraceae bacterium]
MSIHQFKVKSIDGGMIDFADFKGKKLMVVNVASECGFTNQFAQLQELHEKYGDKIEVIGFPSNDFGGQEPKSEAEILDFCRKEYHVTFPLTEKVKIKGRNKHPVYNWLTKSSANGKMDSKVGWNFQKYLINEDGELDAMLSPANPPICEVVLAWLGE